MLGSAGIAVLMESRLAANLPAMPGGGMAEGGASQLPEAMRQGFSDSMAQSLMLPAAVLVIGLIAALLFAKPTHMERPVDMPAKTEAS